jgi:hypothetical protein
MDAAPPDANLDAAWALPVAAIYRRAGLLPQRGVYLCGPTSIVNVLRSLGDAADPRTVLDGTGLATLFGARLWGMTLDQLAQVVRARGRRATVRRDLDADAFRAELLLTNDPARRYIANFHRGPLLGWGGGHHSPLGGYLADRDPALILDVNRRFGAWLAPAERLHAAVTAVDSATGSGRGLLRVE